MENQEQNNEVVLNRMKKNYVKIIVGVIALVGVAIFAVAGWGMYKKWQMRKGVEKFTQTLKQLEQVDYQRAMADTYGGKTPQETLQMYIDAVEKGDFELASKYFIGEEQEKELDSLKNSQSENIKNVLGVLKKVEIVDIHAMLEKKYEEESNMYNISESKKDYVNRLYEVYEYNTKATMNTKIDGYDFSINFRKYPNGIWKIMKI